MPDLEAEFSRAQGMYAALKRECEALVKRERWATGPLIEVEPLEIVRRGEIRGEELFKRPRGTKNRYFYGLDAKDRLIVRARGTEIRGQLIEEFFFYGEAHADSFCFNDSPDKSLLNVRRRWTRGQLVVRSELHAVMGRREETFIYNNKQQLVSIEVVDLPNEKPSQKRWVTVRWGTDGELSTVTERFENGYEASIYPP